MITNLNILADRLKGVKVGDQDLTIDLLKDMMSKEESFELQADPVSIYTEDQINTMKDTVRKEQATKSYAEGKTAGGEMSMKDLKRLAGLEEGTPGKTPEEVFNIISEKIAKDTGAKPNEKIQELQGSLQKLQQTISEKQTAYEQLSNDFEGFKKNTTLRSKRLKNIPENLNGIKPEHFLAAAEVEGITTDMGEDGTMFALRNGQPVKDQLEKYVPVKDVYEQFAKDNGWVGSNGNGGSGGGDYKGGSGNDFKTMNDVFDYMLKNNIKPDGEAGIKLQQDFEAKTKA